MNIVGHIFRPLGGYKRHIGTYRTDFYPAVTLNLYNSTQLQVEVSSGDLGSNCSHLQGITQSCLLKS